MICVIRFNKLNFTGRPWSWESVSKCFGAVGHEDTLTRKMQDVNRVNSDGQKDIGATFHAEQTEIK